MTNTPTLNPQVLGQAENAHRALLDRLLAQDGIEYGEWVVLAITAAAAGHLQRETLVERITSTQQIEDSVAMQRVAKLTEAGLLEVLEGSAVALSETGLARYREARRSIDDVMVRVYANIATEELATAGRVLTLVTAQAVAELALLRDLATDRDA